DRARNGTFEALAGPHAYDPAAATDYRQAAVLALFTPTAERTSTDEVTVGDQVAPHTAGDGAARPPEAPSPPVALRDTDVFLVQRSPLLRHHPGQIALPGGSIDPDDDGPVAAALRETQEETGIPADHVEVLGTLPP